MASLLFILAAAGALAGFVLRVAQAAGRERPAARPEQAPSGAAKPERRADAAAAAFHLAAPDGVRYRVYRAGGGFVAFRLDEGLNETLEPMRLEGDLEDVKNTLLGIESVPASAAGIDTLLGARPKGRPQATRVPAPCGR